MKNIKSIICIALAGLSLTSCKDFLTLMPLNEIVLENFWTDKSDVESVLLGAYNALEKSDCITRMSIWGEMRSDNIVANESNASNDIIQITKDNILETNSYTSWKCFYDVINRANTVLYFAPQVADIDPNYTNAELASNEAEAIALRSLCYWYLIRAYKDVPYVEHPSIDDTYNFFIPATPFGEVLTNLINDLDSVKDWAVNKYTLESANTGRITKVAIYAMLADMYLWRGDWDKAIECCDFIIEYKTKEYEELKEEEGADCTVDLIKGIPMIKSTLGSSTAGNAYKENFGEGNSFEVLFELAFEANQSVENSFVSTYYGSRNTTKGNLLAAPQMGNNFEQGSNKVFISKFDGRFYESMTKDNDGGDFAISKYVNLDVRYNLSTGELQNGSLSRESRNSQIPNWIIYRFSEVLLMKAEALVMKAGQLGDGATAAQDSLFREAFKYVQVVNQRALCIDQYTTAVGDTLKYSNYNGSVKKMEELVLDERRRELCFEGKRWFDLVRMARRDGNTTRLSTFVLTKYTDNVSAVRIKLADTLALYFPISKDERKINTLLHQNPAYIEDEFIEKAK